MAGDQGIIVMASQQQLPSDLHADQGAKIIVIAVIFYSSAVVTVAFRFLSRKISSAVYSWDDFAVLAAVVSDAGGCVNDE